MTRFARLSSLAPVVVSEYLYMLLPLLLVCMFFGL